jgi:hypothetical protein
MQVVCGTVFAEMRFAKLWCHYARRPLDLQADGGFDLLVIVRREVELMQAAVNSVPEFYAACEKGAFTLDIASKIRDVPLRWLSIDAPAFDDDRRP